MEKKGAFKMKNMKDLLTKENVEKAKDVAAKVAEVIPEDMLNKVTGAGNPFDKIPRVPTQPIDDELREDG
jgi:hypothetical protein